MAKEFYGRTLARSQALQLLFQAEATGRTVDDVLAGNYALSQGPLDPFGEMLARGADAMRSDLDKIIAMTSTNWSIRRMPAVDRNLLRLALYEMLAVDEVAVAVTIDESVELAKAYGTAESSRFINGLLGKVARKMDGGADVVAEAREAIPDEPEPEASDEPEAEGAFEQDAEAGWPDADDGGFEAYVPASWDEGEDAADEPGFAAGETETVE